MSSFTDQTGNIIELNKTPQRVISLVPSQTELLYYLGLNEEVIGITKFCVRPENWYKTKKRVGGTKNIRTDIVFSLAPDLIIANKEENVKEQVEELKRRCPVWVSDVNTLQGALNMIAGIGKITNACDKAESLIKKIEEGFERLRERTSDLNNSISAAYLIWKDPYMAAGEDSFIHDMMRHCRFQNVFEHISRYPVITMNDLQAANCKLLLLSSEPYPFNQKHLHSIQQQLPDTKILLVDGEMFSWYGSRLLYAPAYFESLLREIRV